MNSGGMYTLARGDQRYGPYTLEQLREYLSQGSVQPTDLVWAQGMSTWTPVSEIVKSASTSTAGSDTPPSLNPYAPPQAPVMSAAAASDAKPPSLHWGLVLLLAIVTCGVFALVWMFVQAAWARRVDPTSKALKVLAISVPAQCILLIWSEMGSGREFVGFLANIVGLVTTVVAYFDMKAVIETRYQQQLSWLMTFFFNVLYLQYHMTRIANGEHTPYSSRTLG